MAISVTNIGTNNGKAVTTLSITVPVGGVPSGALIVVGQSVTANALATPTDSASNTYQSPASLAITLSKVAFCFNCAALVSGNIITVNTGVSQAEALSAFYATGIQTSSNPLDATGNNSGSSVSPTVTTSAGGSDAAGTTSVTGELIVGYLGINGPIGGTFTQDSTNEGGFATPFVRDGTTGAGGTSNAVAAGGNVVWNSIGKPTYAPTITTAPWQVFIATFKPASTIVNNGWFRPWEIHLERSIRKVVGY